MDESNSFCNTSSMEFDIFFVAPRPKGQRFALNAQSLFHVAALQQAVRNAFQSKTCSTFFVQCHPAKRAMPQHCTMWRLGLLHSIVCKRLGLHHKNSAHNKACSPHYWQPERHGNCGSSGYCCTVVEADAVAAAVRPDIPDISPKLDMPTLMGSMAVDNLKSGFLSVRNGPLLRTPIQLNNLLHVNLWSGNCTI